MAQTLRRSRLKVIAEMTSSPALNSNIQQYGHTRNGLFMTSSPPPPTATTTTSLTYAFANEYVRADNPAAFRTECNRSLLLIELQTSNKQTKKHLEGRDQFFFWPPRSRKLSRFFFCVCVILTLEAIQRRADAF